MVANTDVDVAIVGGGLAGGLAALALTRNRPDLRLLLVEEGRHFGGNHIWSFFASDIEERDRWLIAPLIAYGWTGVNVHFPNYDRNLGQRFYSITSERLDECIRETLPANARLTGARVASATPERVVFGGGQRIKARCVIDARGPANAAALDCGWQKFVGRHLVLEDPHGIEHPVVMDATVEQRDGYRFIRMLPLGPAEILVEDVYYSDVPVLDKRALARRIDSYVKQRGWRVEHVKREQSGVLPVLMGGKFDDYWEAGGRGVKIGTRAALFNPFTGFSVPDAVKVATMLAGRDDFAGRILDREMHAYASEHWAGGSFYRMTARMLFRGGKPEERVKLLERLFALDENLIMRFYAGQTTPADRTKILSTKSAVPFWPAMRAALGGGKGNKS